MDETPRRASTADIVTRIERLEAGYAGLAATVERVELNQRHAEDINKLRFDALDMTVKQMGSDLKGFMARIEGILSGEVQTSASREGRELVEEYQAWRKGVDADRQAQAVRNGRLDLIGKIVVLLATGNIVTAVIAVAKLLGA